MTEGVMDHTGSVTDHAANKAANRRKHVREANVRYRARRRAGRVRLAVELSRNQLDALEERGYLDPFDRGNRADECEAIERFLADSLARPR